MKKKGFTLLELIVTVGLMGVACLFGISLFLEQDKERRKNENASQAYSQIRQFFDLRRRFLQTANQLTFTSYNESGQKKFMKSKDFSSCVEGEPDCQESYRAFVVEGRTSICQGGIIRETVETECVNKNPVISTVDLNSIGGPGAKAFEFCAPVACAAQNGIIRSAQIPRIKITRRIPKRAINGTCVPNQFTNSISYFPPSALNRSSDGTNGNPVAAVACLQVPVGRKIEVDGKHCGTTGASDFPNCYKCEEPQNAHDSSIKDDFPTYCPLYRDFNISVVVITRHERNIYDAYHQAANFPRPKIEDPEGVRILQQVPGSF